MSTITYLITNIYMGAGIAADVYAATLASFREFDDESYLRNWVRRNTITHTLFPLIGMYAVVAGIALWRPLQTFLFSFGAFLLGTFLWHLLQEKLGKNEGKDGLPNKEEAMSWLEKAFTPISQRLEAIDPQWALVLGVSMDAINSGFAKAADTRDWPLSYLLISFPLVGCVVGAGAWLGGQKAKWFLNWLQQLAENDLIAMANRLARLEFVALLIELLVLGYFLCRSATSAVVSALAPWFNLMWLEWRGYGWIASASLLLTIYIRYGQQVHRHIKESALRSFKNEGGDYAGDSY